MSLAVAVAVSALGMAFHTVREFGWSGLHDPSTGFLPVVGIQIGLLAWWLKGGGRRAASWLLATGVFQLVGGAILSVLPLPILPFAPEQSVEHYVSHVVLGLTQAPLLAVGLRERARPTEDQPPIASGR